MSLPSPLYVSRTNETYLTITGCQFIEQETITFNPGKTYRNDPLAIANMNSAAGDNLAAYQSASDLITVTAPHDVELLRARFVYRDSPEIVLSCTTANASNNLTIPAGASLIVGMGVAGTGIATGSTITAISSTTAVLSQPMTASATVNVTFTGNSLGKVWVDEWDGESAEPPIYLS